MFSFPSNCVNIWQQKVLAVLIAKRDAQSKAWDILLVLTSVAGNLCNKCPSGYSNKTAVKVILSMRSLVSIKQQSPRRPCDIIVHCHRMCIWDNNNFFILSISFHLDWRTKKNSLKTIFIKPSHAHLIKVIKYKWTHMRYVAYGEKWFSNIPTLSMGRFVWPVSNNHCTNTPFDRFNMMI